MCGIVGYLGDRQAIDVLAKGLKCLEYRGYDSIGVTILDEGELKTFKRKGKVDSFVNEVHKINLCGTIGIGHTRWATHGVPSDNNAHPHTDCTQRFSLVHNGIIENYSELKATLLGNGHKFLSDTDTETIVHLIEEEFENSIEETVLKVIRKIKGSYAMAIIDKMDPQKIVAVRKDSPMVIGIGENENFVASDIPALLEYTKNMYILEDGEIAVVRKKEIKVCGSNGKSITKKVFSVNWDAQQISKNGYEDYMLKEIFEQPQAIRQTLGCYLNADNNVELPFSITREEIQSINRITIIACGTASYAGRAGEYILEALTGIPTKVEVGSEYRYKNPIIDNKNLIIVLSQSGETADTLASMRKALSQGAKVIGVTNVKGSSVSRELECVLHTLAGPEIAVASTKAFITQLISIYLIGLHLAKEKGSMNDLAFKYNINILRAVPEKITQILNNADCIKEIALKLSKYDNMFFIGRNSDYPICLEGSHKLKEISYIHAEAYEAGELKHGALALVTNNMPVICLMTVQHIYEKMISNITEVQARNAIVINIRSGKIPGIAKADYEFVIPDIDDICTPILAIVPLQLFAYYVAKFRRCDVDQPRNLAKSVTVE